MTKIFIPYMVKCVILPFEAFKSNTFLYALFFKNIRNTCYCYCFQYAVQSQSISQ